MHRRFSDHESQVILRIDLAQAVMGSGSEDQEVLRSFLLRIACSISIGIIILRVRIDFGIAQSRVNRGNDHGTWDMSAGNYVRGFGTNLWEQCRYLRLETAS